MTPTTADTSVAQKVDYLTPEANRPPLPRPNLKPRRGLLWASLGVFAIWLAFLAWVYASQILMKR